MLMEYTDSSIIEFLAQITQASSLATLYATQHFRLRYGSTLTSKILIEGLEALRFSLREIRHAESLILKEIAHLQSKLDESTTNSTASSAPSSKTEESPPPTPPSDSSGSSRSP